MKAVRAAVGDARGGRLVACRNARAQAAVRRINEFRARHREHELSLFGVMFDFEVSGDWEGLASSFSTVMRQRCGLSSLVRYHDYKAAVELLGGKLVLGLGIGGALEVARLCRANCKGSPGQLGGDAEREMLRFSADHGYAPSATHQARLVRVAARKLKWVLPVSDAPRSRRDYSRLIAALRGVLGSRTLRGAKRFAQAALR